jgi:hypothetical protein
MKPRSTSHKNFMRRFHRQYQNRLIKSDHLRYLYEIDGLQKHSEVLERMALWFFASGAMIALQYGNLMMTNYELNKQGPNPQTNFGQFPAQDVPIFLHPEFIELIRQSTLEK